MIDHNLHVKLKLEKHGSLEVVTQILKEAGMDVDDATDATLEKKYLGRECNWFLFIQDKWWKVNTGIMKVSSMTEEKPFSVNSYKLRRGVYQLVATRGLFGIGIRAKRFLQKLTQSECKGAVSYVLINKKFGEIPMRFKLNQLEELKTSGLIMEAYLFNESKNLII